LCQPGKRLTGVIPIDDWGTAREPIGRQAPHPGRPIGGH
jgi:hypothetical protein